MATHFITGGAGFIGSNYARHLLHNTDDYVVIYDALTYAGKMSTLHDIIDSKRLRFIHGDICNWENLIEAMRGSTYIAHFAAESHVDRSIFSSDAFVRTNCMGTDMVMNASRYVEAERVIHISTDEVYGSVEIGKSLETDQLQPRSPYSASKAGSDLIALSHFYTHGLPIIVTRCTNNFGPYQFPEKAIPLFITNLIENKQIPLYGDGLNERDWIHVEDHCSAIKTVLNNGIDGQIYNIGTGSETANIDLVNMILSHLNMPANDWISYVEDRKGHDRRYAVNTEKIEALGWRRKHSLSDDLLHIILWYKANEWWWRPLKNA